jgi:uncharacterized protein
LTEKQSPAITPMPAPAEREERDHPSVPGHWIFLGPKGLRAGWAILVYATLCAILVVLCSFAIGPFLHVSPGMSLPPSAGFLLELSQLVPVVGVTAIMAAVEHRPVLSYGFQGNARVVRLVAGFVWGFIAISAVVLLLRKLGYLSLDGRTISGFAALRYAFAWCLTFLAVGLCEEAMFRGYAQYTVTRGIGFWWGALLFSIPFGLMHLSNPGESPVGLAAAAGVSLIFCLSLWYTGSLWWAVGFHAAWDWGQSYFYGTADSGLMAQGHLFSEHPVGNALWSGGATGPEGSIAVLPALAVVALLMWVWWRGRGERPFRGMAWRPGPQKA